MSELTSYMMLACTVVFEPSVVGIAIKEATILIDQQSYLSRREALVAIMMYRTFWKPCTFLVFGKQVPVLLDEMEAGNWKSSFRTTVVSYLP